MDLITQDRDINPDILSGSKILRIRSQRIICTVMLCLLDSFWHFSGVYTFFCIIICYAFYRCGILTVCINIPDKSNTIYAVTDIFVILDNIILIKSVNIANDATNIAPICCRYSSLKSVILNITDSIIPALYHTRFSSQDAAYIVASCYCSAGIAALNSHTRSIRRSFHTISVTSAVSASGNTACIIPTCCYCSIKFTVCQFIISHSLTLVSTDTAYKICTVNICIAYAVLYVSVEGTAKRTDIFLLPVISDDYPFFYSRIGNCNLILSGCISSDKSGL